MTTLGGARAAALGIAALKKNGLQRKNRPGIPLKNRRNAYPTNDFQTEGQFFWMEARRQVPYWVVLCHGIYSLVHHAGNDYWQSDQPVIYSC